MSRLELFETSTIPLPIFFKHPFIHTTLPRDRPAWIPVHLTNNWDSDPYAYQTEQELMPAGGPHGDMLTYITEVIKSFLKKQGLTLLVDTFLLYRDIKGIKQRIAPDLLIMKDNGHLPAAYDLDILPVPRCVIEIISPKSRHNDLKNKVAFYMDLGIESYLVIDAVTTQNRLRDNVQLRLWRQQSGKFYHEILPDSDGYLILPEMNLKIMADKQKLILMDTLTGTLLRDNGQLSQILAVEIQRAEQAEQQAERESVARLQAEQQMELAITEISRLKRLLAEREA